MPEKSEIPAVRVNFHHGFSLRRNKCHFTTSISLSLSSLTHPNTGRAREKLMSKNGVGEQKRGLAEEMEKLITSALPTTFHPNQQLRHRRGRVLTSRLKGWNSEGPTARGF